MDLTAVNTICTKMGLDDTQMLSLMVRTYSSVSKYLNGTVIAPDMLQTYEHNESLDDRFNRVICEYIKQSRLLWNTIKTSYWEKPCYEMVCRFCAIIAGYKSFEIEDNDTRHKLIGYMRDAQYAEIEFVPKEYAIAIELFCAILKSDALSWYTVDVACWVMQWYLTSHNLGIFVYSGNHDALVNAIGRYMDCIGTANEDVYCNELQRLLSTCILTVDDVSK